MPTYESPGTANLRANESIKAGKQTESPSGSGKDCGGTSNLKEKTAVKVGRTKETNPRQRSIDIPGGVQSFDDDMGRN
jgi:hypothetical protein